MADAKQTKAQDKVDLEAERLKREEDERIQQEIQAHADAEKAASEKVKREAPATSSDDKVVKISDATKARLVLKKEVHRRAEERYGTFSIIIDQVPIGPGTRDIIDREVLNNPGLLWPLHDRLPRFSVVVLHDVYFTWEVTARVMRIDNDLHLVQLAQVGPILVNQAATLAFNWEQIEIVDRGAKGKWSLLYKDSLLKDGFETREAAEKFVVAKRIAA